MNIPKQLFAGDSGTWNDEPTSDNLGGSIDSTWTLKYVIGFPTALTLTATANGSGWTTSVTKTQTAVAPGEYYWQAYAEKASRRETIGSGVIKIKPAAASGISGKSQTQKDLDAVQAALRGQYGDGVAEYTIGGRSLRKIPIADLIKIEGVLKSRVTQEKKAEDIANGIGNPSNIYVRFGK